MMHRARFGRWLVVLCFAAAVAACGLYTPDKDPFSSDAPAGARPISKQGSYESGIVDHVTCEISKALSTADERFKFQWLKNNWGTAVTLTITVEDQTGLSPGLTAITPMKNVIYPYPAASGGNVTVAQSFSFSAGGTASVNALRTETIQFTIENKLALARPDCINTGSGVLIDGDLKIREFIFDKAQIVWEAPGLWNGNKIPYNAWTEEITFVSAYGGAITPTWKLARLSANTSSNLVVAERTNTNDLVLTLGPLKCPAPKKPVTPTVDFQEVLDGVRDGAVASLQMDGNQIRGKVKAGKFITMKAPGRTIKVDAAFQAFVPNDPTRMQSLYALAFDNKVSIGTAAQQSAQECPDDGPVALVDAAMNQHNARVAANAIAVSASGQSH
jgi:hypothetical protein